MGKMQRDKGAEKDLSVFILGEFIDQYECILKSMKILSAQASKYGLRIEHIRRVHDEKSKIHITNIADEKAFYENQLQTLNGK